jgi:hypothetical protein
MIRSVFCVVEYLQGNNSYLLRHEVYLFIFDAFLMLVCMCLFNWVHPEEVADLDKERVSNNNMHATKTQDRYMQYEII